MNLSDVMDELGAALESIPALRVLPFWADRVVPPAAVIGWPDEIDYDTTFARGADRHTIPVWLLVGKADARSSRDRLAQYVRGSAEAFPEPNHSVKAAIEAAAYTACDSVRVTKCEPGQLITVAGVDYLAAQFTVDVIGTGA